MAAAVFIIALAINVVVTLDDPFVMLSDEAIATTSADCGTNSFGPNGGSWQTGIQSENNLTKWEYVKVGYSPKFSIGFFFTKALAEASVSCDIELEGNSKLTTAYTCSGDSTNCCAQVNRYTP